MPDIGSLPPGTRLGPYEVAGLIGAGGMGQVYLARDPRLDRNVAIKVLPPEFASDESRKQRFQREAKAISQFSHPHICTLYDVGEARLPITADAVQYLVMEYVDGQPLDKRILKGPLPLDDVLRFGFEIADALARAHKQGIIHRDLKPGNIMLTKSGAKLLDFGLAKYRAGAEESHSSTTATAAHAAAITEEGRIVGTFRYMPPEQLEGKDADARTDIWALGCVLYEMATGVPAFDGPTRTSLITAIVSSEPKAISTIQPMAPPMLEHVIRKCLAKDPDDRWQSAHDAASELRWIRESGSQASVAAPVVARRKRRETLAWSVAALAVIVAVAAGLGFYRASQTRKPLALNISPNVGYSFGVGGMSIAFLAISPTGDQVVFGARDPETEPNPSLWVRDLNSASARTLPGTGFATKPFYSPDGRFIAYFQGEKLRKIPVSGGAAMTIGSARFGDHASSGSWNSDGVVLFTQTGSGIHRVSASGGEPVPVTTLGPSETSHREVSFLPDGNHFLYLAIPSSRSDTEPAIYVSSLDGMKPKLLVQARSKALYAAGYLLYVRNGTLMAHKMDMETFEVTGDPIPIAENVKEWTQHYLSGFTASPRGPVMYLSSPPFKMKVGWFDRSGRIEQINTPDEWQEVRVSPDGNSFVGVIRKEELSDLWLYDLQKNVATRFTFGTDRELSPVWSRDGKQIAYVCNQRVDSPGGPICLKDASGSGPEVILEPSQAFQWPTDFSPDGQYLAITKRVDRRLTIELLPLRGGKPIAFHPSEFSMQGLHFSPDGKWAAYTSEESGLPETYAVPFPGPGGKWQVSVGGSASGRWSRDGSEILFTRSPRWFAAPVKVAGDVLKIGAPQLLFEYRSALRGDGIPVNGRFLFAYGPENEAQDSLTILLDWTSALKK